jgi:hypothetical protein
MRFRFWIQILGLMLLSVLIGFTSDLDRSGAWFQSPLLSVLPPDRDPAVVQVTPTVFASPPSQTMARLRPLFDAPVWVSFWLWMAVGLIVFCGLAWVTVRLMRRGKASA